LNYDFGFVGLRNWSDLYVSVDNGFAVENMFIIVVPAAAENV